MPNETRQEYIGKKFGQRFCDYAPGRPMAFSGLRSRRICKNRVKIGAQNSGLDIDFHDPFVRKSGKGYAMRRTKRETAKEGQDGQCRIFATFAYRVAQRGSRFYEQSRRLVRMMENSLAMP